MRISKFLLLAAMLCATSVAAEKAPIRGVGDFAIPTWFKNSFLDLRDDAAEASLRGRTLLVYIGQDGCPYCAALFNTNFSQKPVVDYARAHFDAVDLNMWGDRTVVDFDGETLTEKAFAAKHEVWFTPTILFFDGKGKRVLRMNGYYPPRRFLAALRYAADASARGESFAAYLERVAPPSTPGALVDEPFVLRPPYDLQAAGPPIVVFFEQRDCDECRDLHRDVLAKDDTRRELTRFRAIQLDRWSDTPVVTPGGERTTARRWADTLAIGYLPAAVFFDEGNEVIRVEAMFRAFHVQSIMDYVASRAYRTQPSFQRFIQGRSDGLREGGVTVDLWK
jgi:thioredoxin-related protein